MITLENEIVEADDSLAHLTLLWELVTIDGFDDINDDDHRHAAFMNYYRRLAIAVWKFGQFHCPVIRRKCNCFNRHCPSCYLSEKMLITLEAEIKSLNSDLQV